MQENNFEKHVRQKMDELKLTPSDAVWGKVARVIAKRKGDRRLFAIAFLLIFLICVAVFMTMDRTPVTKISMPISDKTNPASRPPVIKNRHDSGAQQITGDINLVKVQSIDSAGLSKKISKVTTASTKNGLHQIPVFTIDNAVAFTPRTMEKQNKVNTITADSNDSVNHSTNTIQKIQLTTMPKVDIEIRSADQVDIAAIDFLSHDTGYTLVKDGIPLINDKAITVHVTDTAVKISTLSNTNDQLNVSEQKISASGNENIAVKSLRQLTQSNKWKIGFNLSVGVAATKSGYLGILRTGNSDESKAYFGDPLQSSGGAGPGTIISHTPSKIKSGTGLVVGVFMEKNVSPKINFLFGLNYKTYNSSMMTGARVGRNMTGGNFSSGQDAYFFRSGTDNRYKNNFHFIEVPVMLRYKLGKQNKAPIYATTGISLSRLIGSNALQFDTLTGTYYSNNRMYNKTQVSVSAGLLFSIPGKAKNLFLLGPDINFSLSKMANAGLYKNRRYSYFGIKLQKSIGKNN